MTDMQSVFDPMLEVDVKFNEDYLADIQKGKEFLFNKFLDKQIPEFFIIL